MGEASKLPLAQYPGCNCTVESYDSKCSSRIPIFSTGVAAYVDLVRSRFVTVAAADEDSSLQVALDTVAGLDGQQLLSALVIRHGKELV